MIPDDLIERIRESADIVQVVGEYVELKRTGTDYRGPCPFHQGTNRNFSVSPRKKIYYCFVCHEGGDVFAFLQKRLGLDWPSAVKMVAEKSGIEVREIERHREGPDPRGRFWEMNAAAAEYFSRLLWTEETAAPAREYLTQRGIDRSVAERFGLGFAPREIGLMRAALNALGYDDAALLEGGLMVQPEEASEPRPRFRRRLMFPILDALGRHVGFGGRVIGEGEPKYLNSPETPVFSKGRLLYGLNVAKLGARREERMIIVEGYFDAVRLIAAGVEEVVAPLGTALTEAQAALVVRYAKKVYLLYDADAPGQKAAFRSGDELLRQGSAVFIVTLPDGEDPDSYVARHGADALRGRLADAVDLFERKVQILERAGWFGDLAGKRRALDRLLPTIRATSDPLTRDIYITRASEASGVTRELLRDEVSRATPERGGTPMRGPGPDRREAPPRTSQRDGPPPDFDNGPPPDDMAMRPPDTRRPFGNRGGEWRKRDRRGNPIEERPALRGWGRTAARGALAERELLRALLRAPNHLDAVAERIGPQGFRTAAYRSIFAALLREGEGVSVEALAASLDEATVRALQDELLVEPDAVGDPRTTIAQALDRLRVREIDEQLEEIERTLPLANATEVDAIAEIKRQLGEEKRALGGRTFKMFRRKRT